MKAKHFPHRISKRSYLTLILALTGLSAAHATQIAVNLGPSPQITSHVQTAFSDLNGTQLQGQTLSLDFLFANEEFARLFSVTSPSFEVMITLQTNTSSLVGFLDGTGYLLDQSGSALGTPQVLGSASDNNGSMSAGLFPLLSGEFVAPLDFFGMHADLLLPINPVATITGGEFQLLTPRAVPSDVFGVGPGVPQNIVPDYGHTFVLLTAALIGLLATQKRFARIT